MGTRPLVFVGSSSKGLPIANAIRLNLEKDAVVLVWNEGPFEISKTYIESLEELAKVDFAVLVLTPDDVAVSRRKKKEAPRDNVIFELGLFIGMLGRERSFFVHEAAKNLKIPTDLLGVAGATYQLQASGSLKRSLQKTCTRIRRRIEKLGPRAKLDPDAIAVQHVRREFAERVVGCWWSYQDWDSNSLGAVDLSHDPAAGGIKVRGSAYGLDGKRTAKWDSVATCLHLDAQKVHYYWEGWMPAAKNTGRRDFTGFGELAFHGSGGPIRTAVGVFSERNLSDITRTKLKSTEYRRCTKTEAAILSNGDPERIGALIRKKLKSGGGPRKKK